MKRAIFFILPLCLFFATPVFADTEVPSSYISSEQNWTIENSPYIVNGNLYIGENGVLNIEAGVKVEVQSGSNFEVYGKLNILGEENNFVEITNVGGEIPNDNYRWKGFSFHQGSEGNINYLKENNAGQFIYNDGGELEINNSDIENNTDGIYLRSGTTTIEETLFGQNVGGLGVWGGYLSLTNSTFSDNTGAAFSASNQYTTKIFLRSNNFYNNKLNTQLDLNVDFDIQDSIFSGSGFEGWMIYGEVYNNKSISNIDGLPIITGGIPITQAGRLDIGSGTIIKLNNESAIINNGGILNVLGTKNNPVTITSISDDEDGVDSNSDGDNTNGNSVRTSGIQNFSGGQSNISYAIVKNTGSVQSYGPYLFAHSAILNSGSEVSVDNCVISDSQVGIFSASGTTTATNITFNEMAGVEVKGGNVSINNSRFILNSVGYFGVINSGSEIVNAENNWWNSSSGPYHPTLNSSGNQNVYVSDNVDFDPWLSDDPENSNTLDPVIIVPGIMGSAWKNGEWVIDPIFHVYDNLIETLEANGYSTTTNLFSFGYDWRDSNIYSAEKLKRKIDGIKKQTGADKVDIVAHSMGGLVARAYIQSSNYENDVDQIIFLGTPHKGAPEDYLTWEAGEIYGKDAKTFLLRVYLKNLAKENGFSGDNALFNYIRNWPITSVKELLPIYSYLKNATTSEIINYPDGYPENTFLEYLNSNLVLLFKSGVDVTNIVGNDGENTVSCINITNENKDPLWENGYPKNYNSSLGNQGLELGKGDGTVPEYSSNMESLNTEIESSHTWLPSEAEEEIYKELTGKNIGDTIKKSLPRRISYLKIFSPADILIISPDGNKVGKNFETGEEINEIDGAFYSGFNTNDEYITIPDPIDGEYKIEIQGTGEGKYKLQLSDISNDGINESEFSGYITKDTTVEFGVDVNDSNIGQIIPEDQTPPTIKINSPEEKEYLRSAKINISVDFSDDTEISSSTLMIHEKFYKDNDEYDPFFYNLGTTTLFATSTDLLDNISTSSIDFVIKSNASSTISDINRSYTLGWIKNKGVKNSLIKQIEIMTKFEKRIEFVEQTLKNGKKFIKRIERVKRITDKILAKSFLLQLDILLKQKIINQQTHDILKEDIVWIINH